MILSRARAPLVLAYAALTCGACDVSEPIRWRSDAGPATCAPIQIGSTEVVADVTCVPQRCEAELTQRGCELTLRLSGCASETLRGMLAPGGTTATWTPSETLGACTSVPSPGLLSLECARSEAACRVDVYAPPFEVPLAVEVVPILDVTFQAPDDSTVQPLDYFDPFEGYTADGVLVGDRVLVATYGGRWTGFRCRSSGNTRVVSIDAERMERTGTTTAPPCLTHLARDPEGPGFLGVYGGGTPRLGKFDADARMTASATITFPGLDDSMSPTALLVDPPSGIATAVFSSKDVPSHGSWAISFDAATLAQRSVTQMFPGHLRGGTFTSAGTLALTDSLEGAFTTADARTGARSQTVFVRSSARASTDIGFAFFDARASRLIASATGANGALWTIAPPFTSQGGVQRVALSYERDAVPWAVTTWSRGLLLVALIDRSQELDARVARFDPVSSRYLPGALPIGRGVVRQLLPGTAGRAFAILPWEAKLARIEVR